MPKLKKLNSSKGNLRLSLPEQNKLSSPNTTFPNNSLAESSYASENDANLMNTTISPGNSAFVKPTKRKRVRLFNRTGTLKPETSQELNFSATFVSSQESSPVVSNKRARRLLRHSSKLAAEVNFSEVFQETINSTDTNSTKKNLRMCGGTGKTDTVTADVDFSKAFESSQELVGLLGSSTDSEPCRRHVLFDCQSRKSGYSEADSYFSEMFSQATVDVSSAKPTRKKLPLAPNRIVESEISKAEQHDFSGAFLSTDELELDSMLVAQKKRGTLFNESGKSFHTEEEETDFSKAFSRSADSTTSNRMQAKLSNLFNKMNKSEYTVTDDDDFSRVFVSPQECTPEVSTQIKPSSMLDEQRESSSSKMDIDSSASHDVTHDDLSEDENDISKTLTESSDSTLTSSVNEVSDQSSSQSDNNTRISGTSMSSQTLSIDSSAKKENTHNDELSVSEVFPSLEEAVNEVSNQNFSNADKTRISGISVMSQTLGLDSSTERQNSRNVDVSVSEVFPSMGEITTNNLIREELHSVRVEMEESEKSSVQFEAQKREDRSTLETSNSDTEVAVSETLLISGTSIVSAVNRSVEKLDSGEELTGDAEKNRTPCKTPIRNSDTEVAISETFLISGTSIVSAANRSVEKLNSEEEPTGVFAENRTPCNTPVSPITPEGTFNLEMPFLPSNDEADADHNRTLCKLDSSVPKSDNLEVKGVVSETFVVSKDSTYCISNRSANAPADSSAVNCTLNSSPVHSFQTGEACTSLLYSPGSKVSANETRTLIKSDSSVQKPNNVDTIAIDSETFIISKISVVSTSNQSAQKPDDDSSRGDCTLRNSAEHLAVLEEERLTSNVETDLTKTLCEFEPSARKSNHSETEVTISETFLISRDSVTPAGNRSIEKLNSAKSPGCSRTPFNSPEDSFRSSSRPETDPNSLCLEATARILEKTVPSISTNEAEKTSYSNVVCSQESEFSPTKRPRTTLFKQLEKSGIPEVGPDFSRAFLQHDNVTPASVVKKKLNNFFTDVQTPNIAGMDSDFSKAFVSTQEYSLEISTLKKQTFPFRRASIESIDSVHVSKAWENLRYPTIVKEDDTIVPSSNNSNVLSTQMSNLDLSFEKQTNSRMEVDFSEVFFSMGESIVGNLIREETSLLASETAEKTNVGLPDTCSSSAPQKRVQSEMENTEYEPSIPNDPLISSRNGSAEMSALVEGKTPRRRSSRIQNKRNSQSPKDSSVMEKLPQEKETLTRNSVDSNTSEAQLSSNESARNDSQHHSSSRISTRSSRASSSKTSNRSSLASSSKSSALKTSSSRDSIPNSRDSTRNQSLANSFRSSLRVSGVSSQESLPQSSIRSRKSSSTTIFSLSKMDTYSNDDSIYEKEASPTRNFFKKPKAPAKNKDLISKPNFPQFEMYCNMNFYNVLIKKMEPKFGIYTNSKVVKLMKYISEMVKEITYSKEDPNENVNLFKRNLFDYGIVTTHFDFNMFVLEYLPIRFKNRALPMWRPYGLPSIIKFDPNTLHDPIG